MVPSIQLTRLVRRSRQYYVSHVILNGPIGPPGGPHPSRGRHTDSARIDFGNDAGLRHCKSGHQSDTNQDQGRIGENSAPHPCIIDLPVIGGEIAIEMDLCWHLSDRPVREQTPGGAQVLHINV
jgi:hypothetical protein